MAPKAAKRESKKLEYGKSGIAKMVKLDATRARFDFEDGSSVNFNVIQGNIWEDEKANMPEYVPFKSMKDNAFVNVRVSFEKGEGKVLFINPTSGELKVKLDRFQAPEDSAPTWQEKEGKGKRPYREANPFFEVVDGRWKGCVIRGRLFDNFGLWEEDGNTTVYGEGTGSQNLRDFCDAVGFDYSNVPYSENLLPEIQRVAKENGNEFTLVLNNGYISTYVPAMQDDAFTDESDTVSNSEVNDLLK